MEFPMSIKTKIAAFALTALVAVARSLPRRIRPMQNRSALAGALEPASSAPPWSAARSPPATTAIMIRLSPLRLGSPVRRLRQLHGPRPHLRLLMRSDRLIRGSCVRHGRLIHPVSHPTRPVVPPGGSTFLGRHCEGRRIVRRHSERSSSLARSAIQIASGCRLGLPSRAPRNDGEVGASPLHARHPPMPFNDVAPLAISLAIAN